MFLQYFYFLLLLNCLPPILSTNPSGQFIVEKIDKFHGDIKKKFNGFYLNFDEKIGIKMDEKLGNSMLKREFPSEIMKAKEEVEEYLRGEKTFQIILNGMNSLKLENKKLAELKELQKQLIDKRQKKSTLRKLTSNLFGSTKKQLKLVNFLIESHELVNKFVDEMIVELRNHWFKEFLKTLEHHINEQIGQIDRQYDHFFEKYSDTYFREIENVVYMEQEKLQEDYREVWSKFSTDNMEHQTKADLNRLHEAIFHSAILEKVTLNIEFSTSYFVKKLSENLNNAVDELYNKIGDLIENDQKQEFATLHAKMDYPQLLNIVCNKILERIKPLFEQIIGPNSSQINAEWQSEHFAEIHWLTEFIIVKKLVEISDATQISIHIPILNMNTAIDMEELPEELELKNSKKMYLQEKAILIAQNILFIVAQLNKIYKFSYRTIRIEEFRNVELNEMIAKNMIPKSIGQFFYQKYEKIIKEYKSDSEKEMSPKSEHHSAGPSSKNVGGSGGKEKGKQ